MGFLNNLGFGLIVTLIGMLTVFFGLVLLIGLIKLMENATANLGKSGKKAKKQAEAPRANRPGALQFQIRTTLWPAPGRPE